MQKNHKLIIALLLGLLIGVIVTVCIKKFTALTFSNSVGFEVNPLEVFSLLCNIILAVYITRVLSKENDQDKSEKDLFIKYLQSYQEEFKVKMDSMIELEDFQTPIVKSHFKSLRSKAKALICLAEDNNLIEKNSSLGSELQQKVTEVWELFTDTPRVNLGQTTPEIEQGIQTLRIEKMNKIETAKIDFDRIIFQLAVIVNRK